MTVQAQDSVQYYDGPIAAGTVISITDFTFIDNSHISMKLRNVDGIWEYGVDYTVDGAGTLKRTATILKEVEAGQTLAVYLDVPITQNISPEEGGNFPASTNEFVLDKLTYICQMLYERVARSMQVSIDNPFNGTLSVLAPSKAIKINAAGDGLELSEYDPDTALETTKEYMESAQTAASNALTSQIAANSSETAATQQANLATQQANIATQQANLATQQANIATQQATIATNKASEVVVSGNEALSNIDTAKNNAITSITNQETTSRNVLIDEGAIQIGLIQNEGATQVANVQSTGFYMRDDKLYYINSQGEETEFKSGGSGLEVCDIGMALYVDETKGLRRYLNGQILDRNKNTEAFFTRLQQITTLHPSLLDTEENWQAAKTLSAFGQVGKFVFNYSGDKIVSVRLPRVVNVQGLFDLHNLGMTVSAGLPPIRGNLYNISETWDLFGNADGSFYKSNGYDAGGTPQQIDNSNSGAIHFDASRSSSIYGNSDTVQQEAIQYPYFIQIATGSETENNIINEIELNNPFSLFDSKYSDHELNNLSWLKSEGQWNSKAVYPSAYDELLREYNNPDRLATFNKDAFTVVGSPTITDDGIASGFSSGNYLSGSFTTITPSKFIFRSKGVYSSTPNTANGSQTIGKIRGTNSSPSIEYDPIRNQLKALRFHTNSGALESAVLNITLNDGDIVEMEVIATSTFVTLNAKINGVSYTNTWSGNGLYCGAINGCTISNNSNWYWTGSIDLKQFSITVDGVKVFSGAKSKVKLSTETYTDYDFVLNTAEETFRLPLKNGKENLVGNEYIKINTLPANDTTLTAPANGYYTISAWASQTTSRFYMTNLSNNLTVGEAGANLANVYWNYVMPCKKGDKIQFHYESIAIQDGNFYFCPNIGNGTLYYYVGETVQNANLIDAGRIGEQLANKVDSTNTQWAVNACMPDYSAGKDVSSATIHTATVDGYVFAQASSRSGGNGGHVDIYDKNGTLIKSWNYVGAEATQTYSYSAFMCPIPKGYSYNVHGGVDIVIQFYPAKGTEV